jgi:hypothetical protein
LHLSEEVLDVFGVSKRFIEKELHVRHVTQLQMSTDFPLDHAPCAQQALTHLFLSLTVAHHTVVNTGMPEIAGQFHARKGNPTDPRILYNAVNRPGNFVAQHSADSL